MYVGRLLVAGPGMGAYRVSSRSFPNRRTVAAGGGDGDSDGDGDGDGDAADDDGDDGGANVTGVAVVPTAEAPPTDNPYVSYRCLRVVGVGGSGGASPAGGDGADGDDDGEAADGDAGAPRVGPAGPPRAVLGNGSHVDPVAEKLELGYPARDALATGLLTLDYERDDHDTPRIGAVVTPDRATVGVVRRDALLVEDVAEPTLVATYGRDDPDPFPFPPEGTGAATGDRSAGGGDRGGGAGRGGGRPSPAALARAAYDLDFEHPVCAAAAVVDGDGVRVGTYDGG